MTYEHLLGLQPPTTAGGNHAAARLFAEQIASYLNGKDPLSTSQRNYLYKLRARWDTRANGKDATWNEHGNKPGRKRKLIGDLGTGNKKIDRTAYGTEEELDPLLRGILRKFGTPVRTDDI